MALGGVLPTSDQEARDRPENGMVLRPRISDCAVLRELIVRRRRCRGGGCREINLRRRGLFGCVKSISAVAV
jgi:hypothetical protein